MINEPKEDLILDIDGKKVPLSRVNKPHFAVVGGTDKPIPNLKDFPPLEPQNIENQDSKPSKDVTKTKNDK